MNPENPWFRLVVAMLGIAIAIRVIVDLLRPTLPYLAGALVIAAVIQLVRMRGRW